MNGTTSVSTRAQAPPLHHETKYENGKVIEGNKGQKSSNNVVRTVLMIRRGEVVGDDDCDDDLMPPNGRFFLLGHYCLHSLNR